jgi:hypothetical protein
MLTSTLQQLHDKPPAAALAILGRSIDEHRQRGNAGERLAALALRGRRMQTTAKEIDALRGLLRWAKAHKGDEELRANVMADALEKSLIALERRHDSVTEMLLLGMWQSVAPMHGNQWSIVDPDLFDFVSKELVKRFGQNPGAPRHEPRKPFQ